MMLHGCFYMQVTAVQDTITSANAVSKHQSEDISDSSAATAAGVNNVQSAVSGKK